MAQGMSIKFNVIEQMTKDLTDKSKRIDAALARDVTTIYQNAQRTRWMTEGASEGSKWKPLDPSYAQRKRKIFAAYPGQGNKMLIATGHLFAVATGQDTSEFRREIAGGQMTISITTPYAVYVDEIRPFMMFSDRTKRQIRDRVALYLMPGGKE